MILSINLTPHEQQKDSDDVRIEQVVKKKNEFHLIGTQRKIKGHTLYAFNTVTKEIKVAPIERKMFFGFNGNVTYKNEITVEKDCIYLQALNEKNARKKLIRMGYTLT